LCGEPPAAAGVHAEDAVDLGGEIGVRLLVLTAAVLDLLE
jgi:hypothetical protein